MAIQHARICGACDRECPSWAQRCPACGSTAISYQMVLVPTGGTTTPNLPFTGRRGYACVDPMILSTNKTKVKKAPAAGAFG